LPSDKHHSSDVVYQRRAGGKFIAWSEMVKEWEKMRVLKMMIWQVWWKGTVKEI